MKKIKFSDHQKGVLFALIALFSWGIHGPAGRYLAINSVDMYFVTASRFWLGTFVFLSFLLVNKKTDFNFRKNIRDVILLAFIGLFMNSVLYHLTLIYLPATLVMILENLSPVFVLMFSFIVLSIKPKIFEIVALGLSALGLIFIITAKEGFSSSSSNYGLGIVLGILTGLTFGFYTFFSYKLVNPIKKDPLEIISFLFKIFLISSILLTPVFFRNSQKPANFRQWFWLIEMGIFQSGLSYLFWNYALRYLTANTVSIMFFLTILFTTVNEVLFLGLKLNSGLILGGFLIILSGYILGTGSGRKKNQISIMKLQANEQI
ncbi:MAG: DMT family transporter [Candidatus Cloacimonetes bacterium]|nr:DMT family transporter [Candidatus Cloacimonadota bacterium]